MSGTFRRLERNEIQNNASHKEGKTTDFTRLKLERSLKRPMTNDQLQAEGAKNRRLIGEDGRLRKKEVRLAKRYGKDNPGLAGGWGETIEDLVKMLQSEDGREKVKRMKLKYIEKALDPFTPEDLKKAYGEKIENIEEAEIEVIGAINAI